MEYTAHVIALSAASPQPSAPSSSASDPIGPAAPIDEPPPEKLMRAMPTIAAAKPAKKRALTPPLFSTNAEIRPVNRGDVATMTLTLDAVVSARAVFSSMNANVTPQIPAAANSSSSRQPDVCRSRGRMSHSAA